MNTSHTPSMGVAPATARTRPRRLARCRRTVALCTLTAGLAAVLAPAAQAATSVVANHIDGTLTVTAAPGKTNAITVNRPGPFVINDTGDTVSAGSGCTQIDERTVSCSVGRIRTVSVLSGDLDDRIFYNPEGAAGALRGQAGNDLIRLGAAARSSDLNGGAGNDSLWGAAGNDFFDGGEGADVFTGGTGIDAVSYRARTTPVIADIDGVADDGAAGERDNIRTDIENLYGGTANDVLTGSAASNRLFGAEGNDTLNGLGGLLDVLEPGAGNDTLNGNGGDDIASYGPGGDGSDRFSGGTGRDTASYRLHAAPVNVSLDNIANDGVTGERDTNLSDVEDVQGTDGNDTLTAHSTVSNHLFGLDGADTLNTVDGISANDEADGGAGINRCTTDAGDARPRCEP
jgi:Ca2+-binding RTX toxin-like protein